MHTTRTEYGCHVALQQHGNIPYLTLRVLRFPTLPSNGRRTGVPSYTPSGDIPARSDCIRYGVRVIRPLGGCDAQLSLEK